MCDWCYTKDWQRCTVCCKGRGSFLKYASIVVVIVVLRKLLWLSQGLFLSAGVFFIIKKHKNRLASVIFAKTDLTITPVHTDSYIPVSNPVSVFFKVGVGQLPDGVKIEPMSVPFRFEPAGNVPVYENVGVPGHLHLPLYHRENRLTGMARGGRWQK